MSAPWGATPEEWDHFAYALDLITDLLPVVSNPDAVISPDSKMKGKGKTPSAYNGKGEVAGVPEWSKRQTNPKQISKWSAKSDYGICLQTREVRGLDIDLSDVSDADRAEEIFCRELGVDRLCIPARVRASSGRRLLAFVALGPDDGRRDDLARGSFRSGDGLVEFLATGQQFIAAGTHPSGDRYAWRGGLPRDFPAFAWVDVERAIRAIYAEMGTPDTWRGFGHKRERTSVGGELGEIDDPVAEYLEANWETFGTQGGKLFVTCPWKDGHSGDSGETEAAWLLAGTGQYAQGHYACLHASCAGRTDQEFFKAVGLKPAQADDFELIEPESAAQADTIDPVAAYLAVAESVAGPAPKVSTGLKKTAPHPTGVVHLPLPGFERDKQGVILATLGNVAKALQASQMTGHHLRYDLFRGELVITSANGERWRPFRDADAVNLRIALAEANCEEIGKELMRDALTKVAADNEFDSAIHWLNGLPQWDGVDRVARLYPDCFGTDDNEYTQAVGLYVMTAHVGRIVEPGCQADMAPILIGDQGLRKSSGIMALSPGLDFYKKFDLSASDADQSRKMRGVLVGEFDEMRGLNGRGAEEIRSFMTRRFEDWTPKYQEYETKFARRMVFHGSGNEDEILNDPTGERRWLPMRCHRTVDVDRIERERDQLWAEAYVLWLADGVKWEAAERLAKSEHAAFKVTDAWDKDVARWLGERDIAGRTPLEIGNLRSADVLIGALGWDALRIGRTDEMRMARVLKAYGLKQVVRWLDGKTARVWEQPE